MSRPIQDSLEVQQQQYNLQNNSPYHQAKNQKDAMKLLYRNQLDNLMQAKNKQKQIQRQHQAQQRRDFNQKAIMGKQAQKMKQMSYQNYYKMLNQNQDFHQSHFVSPMAQRDTLKDSHINHGIQQQRRRYQAYEIQSRKKQAERKNNYKHDLMMQIEQRRKKEQSNRQQDIKFKQSFQMSTMLPTEIGRYERQRKKVQMDNYKEDLDRVQEDKYARIANSRSHVSDISISNPAFHNAITNPLPYNIQNKYIMKEMGMINKNQSYFATKGTQNLGLS